jgi:hypothetical protein
MARTALTSYQTLALTVCAAALPFLLAACTGVPLPADKRDYAGTWKSESVTLSIGEDGSVAYARREGSSRTTLNAPIQRFENEDFVVGILSFTATFDVTAPPHEVDGAWVMTVDGVELTRLEP